MTARTTDRRCLWCRHGLRRWLRAEDRYGYNGDGLFCSLRCGYAYAVAAVNSGRVS